MSSQKSDHLEAFLDPLPSSVSPSVSLVKYNNPQVVYKDASQESSIMDEETEMLNEILPPREWEEGGVLWRQVVSTEKCIREDVLKLKEDLDIKLEQQQARADGICQIRRELYAQCFEDLIRQTCLECMERGLLLLRCRDELRLTLHAAETLYESSIAFGTRKAGQAEAGKADREEYARTLEEECSLSKMKVEELKITRNLLDSQEEEGKSIASKRHTEEVRFYTRTNQQLRAQFDGIVSSKKVE